MEYYLARFLLQKGLATIYLIAFLILLFQGRGLLWKEGILPIEQFIKRASFSDRPSLFFLYCSDRFLQGMAWIGFGLSVIAVLGISEQMGLITSMIVWFLLWVIYLSFVNVGQIFYGYGWEILLLESGFLAIFLGSADVEPSIWMIWLYRWVLVRVMLGAGLIKLRGDACWKNLTSLLFHYETQPLPGPFSRIFHRLPIPIHKIGVLFTHFIELIVPVFLFFPGIVGAIAGGLTVIFQVVLILSGNLSWLNYITIVLCFSCCPDFSFISFEKGDVNVGHQLLTVIVFFFIAYLSKKPICNMMSRKQLMNTRFDSLSLVNSYGAFGSVTRVRREIILEGTDDREVTLNTKWKEYEFKGKPGRVTRRPPIVSPYHYKIDWQMWFAAMTYSPTQDWFFSFVEKILQGNKSVIKLLRTNPFPMSPPAILRAELYEYHFAKPDNPEGAYWTRTKISTYLAPSQLKKKI